MPHWRHFLFINVSNDGFCLLAKYLILTLCVSFKLSQVNVEFKIFHYNLIFLLIYFYGRF